MKPLFSTAYFPPIVYMAKLLRCSQASVEYKETYSRRSIRNRATILTAGGLRYLTVPITLPQGSHTLTENVLICNRDSWPTIHRRTIQAAYGASPYYLYYKDDIDQLLFSHGERLIDLNMSVLRWILLVLKADCCVEPTEDFSPLTGEACDFRPLSLMSPAESQVAYKTYYQVFSDRIPFVPNLSVLDLIMNLGPESRAYLQALNV